jgi:NAD(P)H-dependent flavin oxidoreductase YrpB (nitropropane dioxygenase family)
MIKVAAANERPAPAIAIVMLHTRICDLFGIELPIINAGMGGVALAPLAAAVSEAVHGIIAGGELTIGTESILIDRSPKSTSSSAIGC